MFWTLIQNSTVPFWDITLRSCPLLSREIEMTRAELMRHALSQALRRVHDPARQEAQDRQIAAGRAKLGHPLASSGVLYFLNRRAYSRRHGLITRQCYRCATHRRRLAWLPGRLVVFPSAS